MGKLGTTMVNGPEDDVLDWDAVDWRQAGDDVRRLRQRIFTASRAGDPKTARNLRKLMLRSWERVVERAAGDGGQCWPQDGAPAPGLSLGMPGRASADPLRAFR